MYRALAYVRRDIIRWSRAPMNVLSTLAMPCAWLLFMGLVMPVDWDGNYLDYVTPSILVMTVMTAGLSGGSSLMFDKMLGYLNNPEESEKVMIRHPDGQVWIHSGDLGHRDEEGFFYFDQRIKRIIKVSGVPVFPTQIEKVILENEILASARA